ncbi:hypothetical protein NSPZN2_130043 [Nitrospira defluvii]|uniref:Gram-positive cocci surface proteins LPxTG domain-containing protein n=1 Tax=Nitrospira defluvii TaxID=330214 RepID=A0ABM8R9G7_9BACT|nr:hypothetical protein NSPZN2_130043 [Nitrospira defluvii]
MDYRRILRDPTLLRRADIVKEGSTDMDSFLLLGSLAVVIGVVGVIVLMKGRKKKDR